MEGSAIEKQPLQRRAEDQKTKHGEYWRTTLRRGVAGVCIALIINIAVLGWVLHKDHDNGVATIYQGSKTGMDAVDLWTHLVINVLSMLLLATCSSCMQCLSAPMRAEIDVVHAKYDWLDVGVNSARNMLRVNVWRRLLWVCLALSSIPLSLFYNSVVFSVPTAVNYLALLVTPEYLDGGAYRARPNGDEYTDAGETKFLQDHIESLVRMDAAQCIKEYNVPVQTRWSHLLLVSDYHSPDDTIIYVFQQVHDEAQHVAPRWITKDPTNWHYDEPLCNGTIRYFPWFWDPNVSLPTTCSPLTTLNMTSTSMEDSNENYAVDCSNTPQRRGGFWTPTSTSTAPTSAASTTATSGSSDCETFSHWPADNQRVSVDYCLALKNPNPACEVAISITLLAVVIAFNVVKLLCLLCTLFLPHFEPLITLGDAMASFLRTADPTTEHQGLLPASEVLSGKWRSDNTYGVPPKPRTWVQPPSMFGRAVRLRQWIPNLSVVIIVFVAGVATLGVGLSLTKTNPDFWTEGLGQPNPALRISMTEGWSITRAALLANTPQVVISGTYFCYNSILTTMLLCKEFSQYASAKGTNLAQESARNPANHGYPLRVSAPAKRSEQVGNWALSLPYAYAIPLTGAMALLHWFVSQAIFAERVRYYNTKVDDGDSRTGVGWSAKGIVASVVVGAAMVIALGVIAVLGRLKKGVPVVGSCSVALAAACHARIDDKGAELKMVSFGVLEDVDVNGRMLGRVGFGSTGVRRLKEGDMYL